MLRTTTFILAMALSAIVLQAQNYKVTLRTPVNGEPHASILPTYTWDTLLVATDSFVWQLSENSDFSTIDNHHTIVGYAFSYKATDSLEYTSTYYWRVITYDSLANYVDTSDVFSFTTVDVPPGTPRNVSPESSTIGLGLNPVLRWTTVPEALNYRVQVARFQNFSDTVFHGVVSAPDTSITVNVKLESYTVYYWHVAAENNNGIGNWSNFWNFTTLYTGLNSPVANFGMNAFPNPGVTSTQLVYESVNGTEKVQLYNVQGQLVRDITPENRAAGQTSLMIEKGDLPQGVYIIRLVQDGSQQSIRVTFQ